MSDLLRGLAGAEVEAIPGVFISDSDLVDMLLPESVEDGHGLADRRIPV